MLKETPSQLPIQSFLLNFPHTLSTQVPNNIWMKELSKEESQINRPRAYRQFMDLYSFMAGSSLVHLLPAEGNFQDLTYVANLGIHLPHLTDRNEIILSNFTSPPRVGEEKVGETFFHQMGYNTTICPYKFEGEADLKYLYGNVYIGGYNQRSSKEAYEWMEKNFDMKILKLDMVDEYLYHLDCTVFPINTERTMICCDLYTEEELDELDKFTEIIDVSIEDTEGGICNSIRMGNMILSASNISELKKTDVLYAPEKRKIQTLEKICSDEGMEPVLFNISEFMKSGAMLSCLSMALNKVDHNKVLL